MRPRAPVEPSSGPRIRTQGHPNLDTQAWPERLCGSQWPAHHLRDTCPGSLGSSASPQCWVVRVAGHDPGPATSSTSGREGCARARGLEHRQSAMASRRPPPPPSGFCNRAGVWVLRDWCRCALPLGYKPWPGHAGAASHGRQQCTGWGPTREGQAGPHRDPTALQRLFQHSQDSDSARQKPLQGGDQQSDSSQAAQRHSRLGDATRRSLSPDG